ncbi:ATP-binding protein [Cutibacterium sp.]|uniref:ATP-binding protein n=1 Tax=Cutibacterium sp. TaxID=1912221 RepID=UPI0026DD42D4|nr:ATP-binding protein [Cutibacterium sp.]MDO4412619.1 ATP-binding protein [Cutibacterium sp.]
MAHGPVYPFCAIVGQEEMKLALILATISPDLSGVLIRGEKGTAKSTAVRGLAALLPEHQEIPGAYHLSPEEYSAHAAELGLPEHMPAPRTVQVPVVELPVGATEDRVTGTLDMETALREGRRRFEPGLLAAAHRAILYVDEVNLLDDHVVDLLLDSAAMGVNTVEREGVSVTHPARFTLVGTMNPEEGELRPQLLDRFGLCVSVEGEDNPEQRIEVIRRRLSFEDDPRGFSRRWEHQSHDISERIVRSTALVKEVHIDDETLMTVARTCINAHVDGHRADIMMVRAARTLAAWNGRTTITADDLTQAARLVLPHRMRRRPLESVGAPGAA